MIRRLCVGLAILACLAVLALSVINLVAPQRNGILALTQVFAPYLFLGLLVCLPLCLLRRRGVGLLRVLMLACLVVFVIRFVPGTVALPRSADPSAIRVPVTTWNLELGQADPAVVLDTIRAMPAGLVGLEELTHAHADPIAADSAIRLKFPYQVLKPRGGSTGLGLLSSWPIKAGWTFGYEPPILSATVTLKDGRSMAVVVAHPLPGSFGPDRFGLPTYDASGRDRDFDELRQLIDPILAAGTPLVLFGDFNTVDREVGYGKLAAGLIDAQHAVGLGPGLTWRPPEIEWLPFGLLRIDHIFSANGLVPLDIEPDCTPRGSDHC
ncbi:MAG: endonuclease/exonuclease/phosphatase family protein, partial [Chloroflexi bacterium]|nr:endonuclease/exonuclease/phosphatase family protein [Chloroflexota bacterium]